MITRRPPWLALILALMGCDPDYSGLEVMADGRLRAGTTVERQPFVIPVGHVARIHARPRSSTADTFDDPESLELRPRDPEVLRIFGDEEDWRWNFVGRSFGSTCVEVLVGGRVEECIEVQVTPAP